MSNFWKTLDMPLINCEINLEKPGQQITWTPIQQVELKTDIKLYVPIVTLSTQGNRKLFEYLKSTFKWTISCNKYWGQLYNRLLVGYFKKDYLMIAIDLSKRGTFDANSKAIQQINFTGNLDCDGGAVMLFIIEKVKKTILDFSKEKVM